MYQLNENHICQIRIAIFMQTPDAYAVAQAR